MTQKGYRQRRACALAGIDRVYRGPPTRPEDADLRARLKDLSSEQRRFGYPCMMASDNVLAREQNAV